MINDSRFWESISIASNVSFRTDIFLDLRGKHQYLHYLRDEGSGHEHIVMRVKL